VSWIFVSIFLIKHKSLVVVWLLLAFVGQTVASTAVSCADMKMMDMSEKMMMMHAMDTSSMDSGPIDSESRTVPDCCQQECNCSMGLSVSATLSNLAFADSRASSSQKIEQYTNILLSHSLTSLYRPPIA